MAKHISTSPRSSSYNQAAGFPTAKQEWGLNTAAEVIGILQPRSLEDELIPSTQVYLGITTLLLL